MNTDRIYLDHAATSWPKPDHVLVAMDQFARQCGAAAGRGGYRSAVKSDGVVASLRRQIARTINACSPQTISLHASGTAALNTAIHGLLRPADHVVTTAAEHNSLLRPLWFLKQSIGIEISVVACDHAGRVDADEVIRATRERTRLVAVTHASNVTGAVQPIEEIASHLRSHRALFLSDAAQTFGCLPIDVAATGIDMLAAPGHKGGSGPLGTGFLYVSPSGQDLIRPFLQGGTGSHSESLHMPTAYPEKLEAGNLNVPALAGWAEGLRRAEQAKDTAERLAALAEQLYGGLGTIQGLRIHGEAGPLPIASVSVAGFPASDLASVLDVEFGVETRAGLHCAALIHQHLGSLPSGTLRLSAGTTTTDEQIRVAINALKAMIPELVT